MHILKWAAALIIAALCSASAASAAVTVNVDMSTQTMHVETSSGDIYNWPVSTAGRGYFTPHGTFSVKSMQVMHRSRKYHNSPMPHSIFFSGGFAIHGTYAERNLGHAASHGCVRLSRANAATLFALVRQEGNARIILTGSPPRSAMLGVDGHHKNHLKVASHHHKHHQTMVAAHAHQMVPLAYAPAQPKKSLFQWLTSPGM